MLTKCNRLNAWQSDLKGRPDSAADGPMGGLLTPRSVGIERAKGAAVFPARWSVRSSGKCVPQPSSVPLGHRFGEARALSPRGVLGVPRGMVRRWPEASVAGGPRDESSIEFPYCFRIEPFKSYSFAPESGFRGKRSSHTHTPASRASSNCFPFFSLPVVSLHFRTEDRRRKEKIEASAGPERFLWPVFSLPPPVERTFRSGNGVQGTCRNRQWDAKGKSKSQEICG